MYIDLVKSFMQFDGKVKLNNITLNYDRKGGVLFTGYTIDDTKPIRISIDKNQIELIKECETVTDAYECYKEMEYFQSNT